jgi:hypothetical protein
MKKIMIVLIQLLLWISGERTKGQQEGMLAAVMGDWSIDIGDYTFSYRPPTQAWPARYSLVKGLRNPLTGMDGTQEGIRVLFRTMKIDHSDNKWNY